MGAVTLIWFVLTGSTAFSAAAADGTASAIAGATMAAGGYSMRGMAGWNVTSPPFRSRTFTPERSISSSEMSVSFSISISSLSSFRFMITPFSPSRAWFRADLLLDPFDEGAGARVDLDHIALIQIKRHLHHR